MVHSRQIGARVKRKEDPRLVTGSSTYVDDLRPPRTAHMAILRSIYAHARIVRVDISAALAHPGVIAAYSGAEFRALCGPLPAREGEAIPGMSGSPRRRSGRWRRIGSAMSASRWRSSSRWIATSRATRSTSSTWTYDPLPAVADTEAALAPDAPQLYDEAPGNVAFTWRHAHGDAAAAFAAADSSWSSGWSTSGSRRCRWSRARSSPSPIRSMAG